MAKADQHHTGAILRTKLHRPTVPPDLVQRDRLIRLMDRGRETPLTLVSAPAGYGKSVLASQWIESLNAANAWLSLDESENNRDLFLEYLLAAVHTAFPFGLSRTESLVGLAEPPQISMVSDYLVNELDAIGTPFYLVLDDYHRLQPDSEVHELLSRMLEHPPAPLHLVILSRQDPNFPLASLRGRGQLTDVRLRDLRFERDETAVLLTRQGEARLSDAALDHLQHEVEGWAVGLRLTALALRHVENASDFLLQMRGGVQHVQNYLLQEVIAQQPPGMRESLLKSSILDRFCPELCNALCKHEETPGIAPFDSRLFLDELQRGDLFVISLDTKGEWFRYHHQFQELLRGQLKRIMSLAEIASLHVRASEWFESRELINESIDHAVAAGEPGLAAEIVERHRHSELDEDRWFIVRSWLDRLPAEIKQQRVELLLTQAWIAHFQYQLEFISLAVGQVERLLDERSAKPTTLAELNYFQGLLLYWDGKGEDSLRHCKEAIELLPEKHGLIGGETLVYLALASHMMGEGEAAVNSLEEHTRAADPAADMFLTRVVGGQAFVHLLSGDLVPAVNTARQLGLCAERSRYAYAENWGHHVQALAHLNSHHLEEALQSFLHLAEQRELYERKAAIDALAGLVLTYQLMQRPQSAASAVEEVTAFARDLGEPQYDALAGSCRARLALLQEDPKAALAWVQSFDPEPHAPSMFFWLEEPPVTWARVQIAVGTEANAHAALELLDTLQPQVAALHNNYQRVDILVLQALALDKLGRNDEALVTMEEAVNLGGPGGWIRPFIEPGPTAVRLLNRLRERDSGAEYVTRILSAAGESEAGGTAPAGTDPETQLLVEPLTNREQQILELLADRLTDKEIAQKLFISPQTVNFHTKHIYQKLGVSSRRQAVAAATELRVIAKH